MTFNDLPLFQGHGTATSQVFVSIGAAFLGQGQECLCSSEVKFLIAFFMAHPALATLLMSSAMSDRPFSMFKALGCERAMRETCFELFPLLPQVAS